MAKQRPWVARDKALRSTSRLWIYGTKPRRHKKDLCFYTNRSMLSMPIPEHLLPSVTWENSPQELIDINGTYLKAIL